MNNFKTKGIKELLYHFSRTPDLLADFIENSLYDTQTSETDKIVKIPPKKGTSKSMYSVVFGQILFHSSFLTLVTNEQHVYSFADV